MSRSKIVLYTQPGCPPCQWLKGFLGERGVVFEERDITLDSTAVEDLTVKYKSHSTPTLVIGDEVLIGFDPERIEKILGE
jgi:glutaredoxin-like YruB-family protein